jgi:transposase-like protein
MTVKRKQHSAQFKFEVALAATKNDQTVNQIASEHQLHPSQVSQWKSHLISSGSEIFKTNHAARQDRQQQEREAKLYEQIGRLQMELEWLKKKSTQVG